MARQDIAFYVSEAKAAERAWCSSWDVARAACAADRACRLPHRRSRSIDRYVGRLRRSLKHEPLGVQEAVRLEQCDITTSICISAIR